MGIFLKKAISIIQDSSAETQTVISDFMIRLLLVSYCAKDVYRDGFLRRQVETKFINRAEARRKR